MASNERAITALACSDMPTGRAKWSLRLLADKIVEFEICEMVFFTFLICTDFKKLGINRFDFRILSSNDDKMLQQTV
jgi:hypothetical protein